jgi:hypothetical protein
MKMSRTIFIAASLIAISSVLPIAELPAARAKALRTTSISSTLIADPKILLKAVMNEFYGTYNKTSECWITKGLDKTYCMKPYKVDTVVSGPDRILFIVIAGQTLRDDGTPVTCHACRGVLGLIVLSENGTQLGLVAKNNFYEDFGTYGSLPPVESFTLRELGPNGSYGWVIHSGGAHGGKEYDFNDLYGVFGDTITAIGSIPSHFAKTVGSDCDGKLCTDFSIKLLIDSTVPIAPFYPLILRVSGSKNGQPFNKTYQVPFDKSSFSYLIPQELL